MADPVRIQAPDGSLVEFPAGTADDVITSVMAKSFPPPAPPLIAGAVAAAPADVRAPAQAAAPDGTSFADKIRSVREAVHAPTRILANNFLLGSGERISAGMDALLGRGTYGDNLKKEWAENDRFSADHPVAAPALEITGSMAAPLASIGAAAKGATLGAKTIYAALAGGGTGAAQGALRSRDWEDVKQTAKDTTIGGLVGGTIGAFLPGTGQLIGKGVSLVANAVRGKADGMSRSASNHLVNALEADTPAVVRQNLDRLGPEATLADAGEAFLGKAQGASLNSDEGRAILFKALRDRDKGTNTRIMRDVEAAMGPAEDPVIATRNILDHRMKVDGHNYPQALDAAPPITTGPMLTEVSDAIANSANGGMEKKALLTLQGMLQKSEKRARIDPVTGRQEYDASGRAIWDDVKVNETRAQVLHKVKTEIDDVIEKNLPGLGVPAGALGNQQFALKKFRHQLNELLEQQARGYAEANAVSAALAKRAEAVERGTQYLGNGKTTPSPERFLDEFEGLTMGERIALAKGSRGEIERKLGTKANDLQALRGELQGDGGWNTAKIATVHGDDAARQLMDTVERNLKFRDTHNKVSENAQTEIRRSAREQMKPAGESKSQPIFDNPGANPWGQLTAVASRFLAKPAWNALTHVDPTRSYGEVAKILTAQGGNRERHLKAIADAMNRRGVNSAVATKTGDRSALAAALLSSALLNDHMRKLPR